MTSRSSSRSRTTSWPGSSLTISSARNATSGLSHVSRGRVEQCRQRSEQALADGRRALVGAGEHHRRSGEVVAPRPDPEIHRLRQIGAVERRAVLTRVDHDLGRGVRVVGDGVRIGAAHHGDVARAEQHRIAARRDDPRVAAHHRHQRQRCSVLDPDRPWRLHDRSEQERSVSPGPIEQTGDRVHRPNVDAE